MRFFVKCTPLKREGVGEVHFHRRWWSWRKGQVFFIPEGTKTPHPVPENRFHELAHAKTTLEAMAILRREEP